MQFLKGFFYGFLIVLVVLNLIGVVFFFFLRPTQEVGLPGEANQGKVAVVNPVEKPTLPTLPAAPPVPPPPPPKPSVPSVDQVFVKFNVKLAPAFASVAEKMGTVGMGVQVRKMVGDHVDHEMSLGISASSESDVKGPYPRSIKLNAPREALFALVGNQTGKVLVRVQLGFNMQPGKRVSDGSSLGYVGILKLDAAQVAKSGTWDLGDIFLTHRMDLGERPDLYRPCKDVGGNFTGKIVPTQEFLAKAAGKKVALVMTPYFIDAIISQHRATGENAQPASVAYSITQVQPTAAGFTYSFPVSKIKPTDYMAGYAAICDEGEDLAACANKHYPAHYPVSGDGKGFMLAAEGLHYKHCNETSSANFILHAYPPLKPDSVPKSGKDRNPALPMEIIEGQMI